MCLFADRTRPKHSTGQSILPDPGSQTAFWDAVEDHPGMRNHPVKSRDRWKDTVDVQCHGSRFIYRYLYIYIHIYIDTKLHICIPKHIAV